LFIFPSRRNRHRRVPHKNTFIRLLYSPSMKERPDQLNWRHRPTRSADSPVRLPLLAGASPASRFPGLSSSVRYPGIAQSVQDSPRRCGADSPAPSAVVPESVGKATSVPPPYDFVLHYSVDSKWTKRIDFRSILVHFEIGTPSRPPSSVLPSSKKNCGKEKVKFWMLHQPLASLSFKHGKEMVKLLCSINGLDVV